MQMQHMRTILLLLPLAGCKPGDFQEYLDTAPIRVASAPGKFEGPSYGQSMVTVAGELEGKPVSRIIASGPIANRESPLVFTRAYEDGKVSESTFQRCKGARDCEDARDIGATLIPFESWGQGTGEASERQLCVYAPANATEPAVQGDSALGGNGYVGCETPNNSIQHFTLGPAIAEVRGDNGTLVFSGFGLPPAHPLGVVMVGVHSISNVNSAPRNGGLYLQLDYVFSESQNMLIAPFLSRVPLEDPATGKPFSEAPDAADLGAQVAGAVTTGKNLVFAISQPSKQRVLVASYDDSLPGEAVDKVRLHACIESPDAELDSFGERVLVGDFTGDGAPEIVIGTDPVATNPGKQGLFIYDGRSLPEPVSGDVCPPWDAAGTPVPCRDEEGLDCDGSGFGASLAIGDVDADGTGDLIVGAPLTSVGGNDEVGAVWVLPGSSDGLDLERSVAITVPSKARARFGWKVAALHTKDRDEPVASAPGVAQIFTIMCTPLESGFGGDELCLD